MPKAFCGPQPALRASSVALGPGNGIYGEEDNPFVLKRDVVEIMFTSPAHGARARLLVEPDMTIDEVLTMGRESTGFMFDWIPNSDFQLYKFDEDWGVAKGSSRSCLVSGSFLQPLSKG